MNFRMCVVVGYCFVVLAVISVTGRKYKPTLGSDLVNTPYVFGYKRNDRLDMHLTLKMPSNLSGGLLLLRSNISDNRSIKTFEIEGDYKANPRGDFVLDVRRLLTSDHIVIDLQLYKHAGVCLKQRITEGREVITSLNTRSPICLNGNNCRIILDLRKECKDAYIPAAPLKIPTGSLTYVPAAAPAEKTVAPTVKVKAKETYDNTNYDVIIICLSIFATVVFVVVTLAFMRRYWINRMATPIQSPLPRNPFYVNLLFRKECQKEIDELEMHIYEEIV